MEELTLSPFGYFILLSVLVLLLLIALILDCPINIDTDKSNNNEQKETPAYLSRYGRIIQM